MADRGALRIEDTQGSRTRTARTPTRAADAALIAQVEAQLARAAVAATPYERLRERYAAHETLVTEAFVVGRVGLQPGFYRLFPPSPELAARLAGPLAALRSRQVAKRRAAAATLEKEARREKGMTDQLWLRDPRTVELLMAAADDADGAVQQKVIRCLGTIVHRYAYPARAVAERLLAVHGEAPPEARREIAIALAPFDDPRKWPILVDALAWPRLDELARRRLTTVIRWQAGTAPPAVARDLTARLFTLLRAEKKAELKIMLVKALGGVGDRTAAAELRGMKLAGVRPEVRDAALATMQASPERAASSPPPRPDPGRPDRPAPVPPSRGAAPRARARPAAPPRSPRSPRSPRRVP